MLVQFNRCLFSGRVFSRFTSIASSSSKNNGKELTTKDQKSNTSETSKNPRKVWEKRDEFARPRIQRFEQVPLKQYWTEDWKLGLLDKDEDYTPLKNYGTNEKKWSYYNSVVWPPNHVVPETGLPKSREVFHCIESIHCSPKRMWYVCQFIRRMNVDEAIQQLTFKMNKASIIMVKLLKETKTKAKQESHIEDPSKMYVAEAFPVQTRIVKGLRQHAKGQRAKRRFRYIDVFVRLEEGTPPDYKIRERPLDGWQKMEKYIEYLRSRDIKYSL